MTYNNKNGNNSEVSWNTVCSYLKQKNETPIPMYGSDSCVMIIKPYVSVELQMRGKNAFLTEYTRLPQFTLFNYNNITTQDYEYLSISCKHIDFNETVLKFYTSIASKFVLDNIEAEAAICKSYEQWKNMLAQPRMPDVYTQIGLWGELFIIDVVLQSKKIDPTSLINNWTGPLGSANDFSFGNAAVDVKTTTKQSSLIEISSMDQLDAKMAWIILVRAFHAPEESGGKAIKTLIQSINSKLNPATINLFSERIDSVLDLIGVPSSGLFSMKCDQTPLAIKIDNTFPLLTRTNINRFFCADSALMLNNVSYTLDMTKKMMSGSTDIAQLFTELTSRET